MPLPLTETGLFRSKLKPLLLLRELIGGLAIKLELKLINVQRTIWKQVSG